jgi:hypothetical protein
MDMPSGSCQDKSEKKEEKNVTTSKVTIGVFGILIIIGF